MSKTIIDIFEGVFFITIGLWFATYFKVLGAKATLHQQKFWNFFRLKTTFGPRSIKAYQYMYLIIGIFFIIAGALIVFIK